MEFNSTILTLPGHAGSGETHWQTLWEKEFGFKRIEQKDWINAVCDDWVEAIEAEVNKHDPENVIIVAHSLGCIALAYWCERYSPYIKGALLVAPCDTEAVTAPLTIEGFEPIPEIEMPFPTILVTSLDDNFVNYERAEAFAECWGSELVNIGKAGHINPASGYGKWHWGLELLKRLDEE
ncbi:RBBP9/YdeN family alpha/beta hydrolase [Alistipes sp. ZOR0009]|jgi:predicted alpha/beta hydrolase family esterase|uniref:RBBP9/YdeN family alpha/beta hydrolase n=1 Tax=Alistipes sp. ZOR0009 TaxID=1339253 RepID=UPI000648957E|nr:alpha/beta hydrolase [Alistipes sp. ZOR0009]